MFWHQWLRVFPHPVACRNELLAYEIVDVTPRWSRTSESWSSQKWWWGNVAPYGWKLDLYQQLAAECPAISIWQISDVRRMRWRLLRRQKSSVGNCSRSPCSLTRIPRIHTSLSICSLDHPMCTTEEMWEVTEICELLHDEMCALVHVLNIGLLKLPHMSIRKIPPKWVSNPQ